MSNEFTRAGNRSHAPGEHEAAKEELGGTHGYNFSHEPKAAGPATPEPEPTAPAPETAATPDAPAKQESVGAMQVTPADYIKKWNELYKNNKVFVEAFTNYYRLKPNENISSKIIEDNVISMLLPGVPLHKDVFEEGMRARFAKTREALKKK